jgi:hypothetical protein
LCKFVDQQKAVGYSVFGIRLKSVKSVSKKSRYKRSSGDTTVSPGRFMQCRYIWVVSMFLNRSNV